jgi:magnesium-transporting ATPase (P-type)
VRLVIGFFEKISVFFKIDIFLTVVTIPEGLPSAVTITLLLEINQTSNQIKVLQVTN